MKQTLPDRWVLVHLAHPLPAAPKAMRKMRALWMYIDGAFDRMNASARVAISLTSTFSRGKNENDLVLIRVKTSQRAFDRFMREEAVWLRAFGRIAVATFPPTKAGAAVRHD